MDAFAGHRTRELFRAFDPGGENHPPRFLQDEIDGSERARHLLCQDDAEIAHFLPGVRNRLLAPVPHGQARR